MYILIFHLSVVLSFKLCNNLTCIYFLARQSVAHGHFAVSCHVKQLMLIFVRNQDQHRHRNEYYSQQCKLKVILANDSANQMCGNTISRVIQCLIMIQKFPELELNV